MVGRRVDSAQEGSNSEGPHKLGEKLHFVALFCVQKSNAGMSRAMLPDKHAIKELSAPGKGWLSREWDNKWNGITGPLQEDPSLRCQVSGICEGLLSCPKSEDSSLEFKILCHFVQTQTKKDNLPGPLYEENLLICA